MRARRPQSRRPHAHRMRHTCTSSPSGCGAYEQRAAPCSTLPGCLSRARFQLRSMSTRGISEVRGIGWRSSGNRCSTTGASFSMPGGGARPNS